MTVDYSDIESASSPSSSPLIPSTDSSPASTYSDQFDPPKDPYPYPYRHSHGFSISHTSSHPSSTQPSLPSHRHRISWTDFAHFIRPKLRIRHRKMPLTRRGRTCFCVVLPLVLGFLVFLSTFPGTVPWAPDREYSARGAWEEGREARDWLGAVLGRTKVVSLPCILTAFRWDVPAAETASQARA